MKNLFFILLALSPALAQECRDINYLTQENSPFNRIPVSDQDGAGICYAYTAAQLMDYHLMKSGQTTEKVMHPTWVALKSSRNYLNDGFVNKAITAVREKGVCSYDNVETALNVYGLRARIEGSPLVAFLETFATEMQQQLRNSQSRVINQSMIDHSLFNAMTIAAPFCDEDVIWDEMLPDLTKLQETSVQLFSRLLGNSCSPEYIKRYQIPEPLVAEAFESNEQAKLTLQDQINKGPFAFSYCSDTWETPTYNGMIRPGNSSRDDCGMHASMAVGQKQFGQHCYLLVRNTWGTGWGNWNKNYSCLCKNKRTGAWVDGCNYANHNDGDHTVEACYIGENQLSRNLQDITTFNP